MKKQDKVIITLLAVILVGISIYGAFKLFPSENIEEPDVNVVEEEKKEKEESVDKDDSYDKTLGYDIPEKNVYKKISLDDLHEKLDSDDDFYLLIGTSTCGYCQMMVPILNDYAESNDISKVYYLDANNSKVWDYLEEIDVSGVPVIIEYRNGVIMAKSSDIDGSLVYSSSNEEFYLNIVKIMFEDY